MGKSKPLPKSLNQIDPAELDASNAKQLEDLSRMGITIITNKQGQIQLFHNPDSAESIQAGLLGQDFMVKIVKLNQEMQEKLSGGDEAFEPKHMMAVEKAAVDYVYESEASSLEEIPEVISFPASPALFGPVLTKEFSVAGTLAYAVPQSGCQPLSNKITNQATILVVRRGDCIFLDKVLNAQQAGAIGVIVIDNEPGSSILKTPLFQMSGDGKRNTTIPCIFIYSDEGDQLEEFMRQGETLVQMSNGELDPHVFADNMKLLRDNLDWQRGQKAEKSNHGGGGRAEVKVNLPRQ